MSESTTHHPLWEKPTHHTEAKNITQTVHWIELFYDLVHVVAIFFLSNFLLENLTFEGMLLFAIVFAGLWISWGDYVFYNSMFVSRDYKHRILSAIHLITVLVMAVSFTNLLTTGWQYFIVAFAINRFITGFLYWRAKRHNITNATLASEMSRNFFWFSLILVGAVFLPLTASIAVYTAVLIGIQLSYILPTLGVMRFERFAPRIGHLAERFSLLLLIVLGEGFFKIALSYVEGEEVHIAGLIISSALLFLLAWMYFDFVGNRPLKHTGKPCMMRWWYSHAFLMFGALLISIGMKEFSNLSLLESYNFTYTSLVYIGIFLYFFMLGSIQKVIVNPLADQFVTWPVRIFGIALISLAAVTSYYEFATVLPFSLVTLAIISQLALPISTAYNKLQHEIVRMRQ